MNSTTDETNFRSSALCQNSRENLQERNYAGKQHAVGKGAHDIGASDIGET